MSNRTSENLIMVLLLILTFSFFYFYWIDEVHIAKAAVKSQNSSCQIYNDKAKELVEESAKDLPDGQTIYFDPRMAKSNASMAYSQIYRNCKEYGE